MSVNNLDTAERRRGRPPGTGIDDSATLAKVADLVLADPGMKPTPAMKRIVRGIQPTPLRRLQVKWRAGAVDFLAQATERRRLKEEARATAVSVPRANPPWLGGMADLVDSPVQRMLRQIEESPFQKALQAYRNDPLQKAILEMENSPIHKAMRDFQESQKALRDAQNMFGSLDLLRRFRF